MLAAAFVIVAQASAPPAVPTYTRDIAPLIERSCVACHDVGGVGQFPLLEYNQVRRRARQIATVLETRFMPPWLPSAHGLPLAGDRRLSDDEIAMVRRWVDGGAPRGPETSVAEATPADAASPAWRLGVPDLILTMTEPFEVPADGADVLRTIVIPTALTMDRPVRAFEFRPTNARTVHHVAFLVDDTGAARLFDESDPGPGYPAMGSIGLNFAGSFGSWAPGSASTMPEGSVQVIPAGADLSLEMHFKPTGRPEREQSQVGLYFADESCESIATSFCLADLRLDIEPGADEAEATDFFEVPVDIQLSAIAPYGRYVCRTIRVDVTSPDGVEVTLLDIPDWNFTFQEPYRFAEPVCIAAGSVITMTYTFDNSAGNPRNPASPPVRVRLGHDPTDELALIVFYATPDDPVDLPMLEAAHRAAVLRRIEERRVWLRDRQ